MPPLLARADKFAAVLLDGQASKRDGTAASPVALDLCRISAATVDSVCWTPTPVCTRCPLQPVPLSAQPWP